MSASEALFLAVADDPSAADVALIEEALAEAPPHLLAMTGNDSTEPSSL